MSGKSPSFSLIVRIYHESNDPRHQVIADWYRHLPTDHQGRRKGIQDTLIDLLFESIIAAGAETPVVNVATPKPMADLHPAGVVRTPHDQITEPPIMPGRTEAPRHEKTPGAQERAKRMLQSMKF